MAGYRQAEMHGSLIKTDGSDGLLGKVIRNVEAYLKVYGLQDAQDTTGDPKRSEYERKLAMAHAKLTTRNLPGYDTMTSSEIAVHEADIYEREMRRLLRNSDICVREEYRAIFEGKERMPREPRSTHRKPMDWYSVFVPNRDGWENVGSYFVFRSPKNTYAAPDGYHVRVPAYSPVQAVAFLAQKSGNGRLCKIPGKEVTVVVKGKKKRKTANKTLDDYFTDGVRVTNMTAAHPEV